MKFSKYHGSGNDFVMLDGFEKNHELNEYQIKYLCHRRMGIGADGLIVILEAEDADFTMNYYNNDGSSGMMCANGARCAASFAARLGYVGDDITFIVSDGIHRAKLISESSVSVSISDVNKLRDIGNNILVDTGAPHLVCPVEKQRLKSVDVFKEGRVLRYSKELDPYGANVNFVQKDEDGSYHIRTYERGVENEVLACGTGITAAAIGMHHRVKQGDGDFQYLFHSRAGSLSVDFKHLDGKYFDIWLTGPSEHVFSGEITQQKLTVIQELPYI